MSGPQIITMCEQKIATRLPVSDSNPMPIASYQSNLSQVTPYLTPIIPTDRLDRAKTRFILECLVLVSVCTHGLHIFIVKVGCSELANQSALLDTTCQLEM
ncbi:unnamed protein product [Fusarium graminearum]|uniref:Uncharacterized protein n=1 Tax=Gibberella zeae TaxID=5518 RepID=A0A9N8RKA8_GIBZA|nr:unnamed protein product [Fusarium graminearum]CAG1998992.1 unnamed protein product [Fusarium graminearum]